ncbi:MAG TPA: FadR family transcriptional regulator, partial [Bacillota bacterium]|nr:FadR family transcriptional regulator [Bacillota bacterium]
FFSFLFAKTENLLMLRIWQLMEEYSSPFEKQNYTKEFYGKLLQYYREKNVNSIESLFTRYEMTK